MVHKVVICSHHDLQALQGICSRAGNLRAQQGIRSTEGVFVKLVSLESMRIAHESYALFRPLVDLRSCICPQLDLFSVVAELHKVEHDLLPSLLDLLPSLQDQEEAKLEGRVEQALVSLKNSATMILCLMEKFEKLFASFGEQLEDVVVVFPDRVKEVGGVLVETADQVLNGTHEIVWLKERVPHLVELVSALMATPVRFP